MNTVAFQASKRNRAVVAKLVDFYATIPSVRRVILFGSRARGDAEERSDIAIDAPRLTRNQRLDILHAAEDAETLLKIQIVDMRDADGAFRESIENEGIVLYERQEER